MEDALAGKAKAHVNDSATDAARILAPESPPTLEYIPRVALCTISALADLLDEPKGESK